MPSTIAVFGATGGTGFAFACQAIAAGHTIRALIRPSSMPTWDQATASAIPNPQDRERIQTVPGDIRQADTVKRTLEGATHIVVSLGSRPGSKDRDHTVCSEGQAVINTCLKQQQQPSGDQRRRRRMVVITSLGTSESYQDLNWFTKVFVDWVIAKPIADKVMQEASVRDTFTDPSSPADVDWTLVRPGGLRNGPKTEKVLAQERGIGGGMIHREDVAWFVLTQCLDGDEWKNKAVSVVGA